MRTATRWASTTTASLTSPNLKVIQTTSADLADYIASFSENIRKIFERFEFGKEIEKLEESNRLYQVVAQFCDIDLHPRTVENITMGLVF